MRILVAITPHMYREAIALSLRQHRPGYEVRIEVLYSDTMDARISVEGRIEESRDIFPRRSAAGGRRSCGRDE